MEEKSAAAVAQDLVATFGFEAESIVEGRIRENARDDKSCGVDFWLEVGAAVRTLTRERLSA